MLRHLQRRLRRDNLVTRGLDCGSQLGEVAGCHRREWRRVVVLLRNSHLVIDIERLAQLVLQRSRWAGDFAERVLGPAVSQLHRAEMSRRLVNLRMAFRSDHFGLFDSDDGESQILARAIVRRFYSLEIAGSQCEPIFLRSGYRASSDRTKRPSFAIECGPAFRSTVSGCTTILATSGNRSANDFMVAASEAIFRRSRWSYVAEPGRANTCFNADAHFASSQSDADARSPSRCRPH